MALGCFLTWFMLLAVDRGKWRYWWAYGSAQFYLLYAYPGALVLVAVINAVTLVLIFGGGAERRCLWGRWFVVSLAGGMLFLQLMVPCLLQLLAYLPELMGFGKIDGRWVVDEASLMFLGQTWHPWDASNPNCRSILQLAEGQGWLLFLVVAIPAVALLMGGD